MSMGNLEDVDCRSETNTTLDSVRAFERRELLLRVRVMVRSTIRDGGSCGIICAIASWCGKADDKAWSRYSQLKGPFVLLGGMGRGGRGCCGYSRKDKLVPSFWLWVRSLCVLAVAYGTLGDE